MRKLLVFLWNLSRAVVIVLMLFAMLMLGAFEVWEAVYWVLVSFVMSFTAWLPSFIRKDDSVEE